MSRWIAVLALVLAGCAAQSPQRASAPPLFQVGSQLVLQQPVTIPGGRTRVFFQRGAALPDGNFDQYRPSCDLEVRTLDEAPRQIDPDRFEITAIEYGEQVVAGLDGVRLAGIGIGGGSVGVGIGGGGVGVGFGNFWWGRGTSIFRYVRLSLASPRQPDVLRLTCRGAWEDYHRAAPPNPVEIQIALGELIRFETPAPAPSG